MYWVTLVINITQISGVPLHNRTLVSSDVCSPPKFVMQRMEG